MKNILSEEEVLHTIIENKLFVKIEDKYIPTATFKEFISLKTDTVVNEEVDTAASNKNEVEEDKPESKVEVKDKPKETEKKFETLSWVRYWNELFPTSSNNPHKRNLRSGFSGKYGVLNKMIKFIGDTSFSKELIVLSTIFYLGREYKKDKFKYTKESGNFIAKKDEPSKLEAECTETLEILSKKGLDVSDLRLVEYVTKQGNTSIKVIYNSEKVNKPEVQSKVETTVSVSDINTNTLGEEFTSITNVRDKMNGENMFEDGVDW